MNGEPASIVRNQRIVYVESISTQGKLLAVSLITWELLPHDNGTRLIITDQLTEGRNAHLGLTSVSSFSPHLGQE